MIRHVLLAASLSFAAAMAAVGLVDAFDLDRQLLFEVGRHALEVTAIVSLGLLAAKLVFKKAWASTALAAYAAFVGILVALIMGCAASSAQPDDIAAFQKTLLFIAGFGALAGVMHRDFKAYSTARLLVFFALFVVIFVPSALTYVIMTRIGSPEIFLASGAGPLTAFAAYRFR